MKPSNWVPTTDILELKVLGKLAEECGELASAASRCIVQGIDESHPISGVPNRKWLTDELADVLANIEVVCNHFQIDPVYLQERVYAKVNYLKNWHSLVESQK